MAKQPSRRTLPACCRVIHISCWRYWNKRRCYCVSIRRTLMVRRRRSHGAYVSFVCLFAGSIPPLTFFFSAAPMYVCTGLEEEAGVSSKKVCYAHGSLQWASCRRCHRKVPARDFAPDILAGRVARCQVPRITTKKKKSKQQQQASANVVPRVSSRKRTREQQQPAAAAAALLRCGEGVCGGVLKPSVTFFGEALQDTVKNKLEADRDKVDALVVIGTSLSV